MVNPEEKTWLLEIDGVQKLVHMKNDEKAKIQDSNPYPPRKKTTRQNKKK